MKSSAGLAEESTKGLNEGFGQMGRGKPGKECRKRERERSLKKKEMEQR